MSTSLYNRCMSAREETTTRRERAICMSGCQICQRCDIPSLKGLFSGNLFSYYTVVKALLLLD